MFSNFRLDMIHPLVLHEMTKNLLPFYNNLLLLSIRPFLSEKNNGTEVAIIITLPFPENLPQTNFFNNKRSRKKRVCIVYQYDDLCI